MQNRGKMKKKAERENLVHSKGDGKRENITKVSIEFRF